MVPREVVRLTNRRLSFSCGNVGRFWLFQGGFLFCPFTEETICLGKEQDAMKRTAMPVNEKYALTITEASRYYNIGIKRLRQMAEEHLGEFSFFNGNKYLIIREKFEQFLSQTSAI